MYIAYVYIVLYLTLFPLTILSVMSQSSVRVEASLIINKTLKNCLNLGQKNSIVKCYSLLVELPNTVRPSLMTLNELD